MGKQFEFEIPADWGCDDKGLCAFKCKSRLPHPGCHDSCTWIGLQTGVGRKCHRITHKLHDRTTFTRAKPKPVYEVELADPQPFVARGTTWYVDEGGHVWYWEDRGHGWQEYGIAPQSLSDTPETERTTEGWRFTQGHDIPDDARVAKIQRTGYDPEKWYFWREVTE